MWYDIIASDLFLLTLTVGLYCVGMRLYRRVHTPLLHPVLLTFIAVIVFLRCTGIDYPRYQEATSSTATVETTPETTTAHRLSRITR